MIIAMTTDITRRGLYTMLAMGSYPVGIIALSAFASKVQVGQNNTKIVSKVQVGSCVFCCKVFVLWLFNYNCYTASVSLISPTPVMLLIIIARINKVYMLL